MNVTESESSATTPNKPGFTSLVWVAAILLAAYVLSPGPVIKLLGPRPPPFIVACYGPLAYLYDHVTAVHQFYDWYFHVWGIK